MYILEELKKVLNGLSGGWKMNSQETVLTFSGIIFIVYYLLNESQIRGMFFLGIILTIFLYDTFFKISQNTNQNIDYKKIQKIFIYVLCLYLLVPLLIHILHATVTFEKYFLFDFAPQLYIVDTFRGFTLDRVQYSFLSGIALILLLFNRKNIKYQKLLIYLLLFGLFISMARASLVALILAFTYYEFFGNIKRKTKKKFLFIIGVLVLIGLAYLFSSRMELFADGGNRIKIINDSLSMILNDGLKTLLFGYGEYYTTLHNGVYPHNSVLQTVLNFGLIITSLWLIMLWQLFTKLSVKSKVMFIYIFTFGLFHAGFSAFVFIPITLFGYLCVLILNNKEESYK